MILSKIIRYLLPTVDLLSDVVIVKRNGVESIQQWNSALSRPTDSEIAEAAPIVEKLEAFSAVQKKRSERYSKEASVYDIADAITKQASTDAAIKAEGDAQLAAVLAKRLQIKAEIPKPE